MRSLTAYGESRLLFWQRVREFAVSPSMIESATARRTVGDWAGACAAARVDVDLDLRAAARAYGSELAAQVRDDLRQLAPDLLRWHMPRISPDGLLRPGLTMSLAEYRRGEDGEAVHLVARTPPAWADAGQRISLALWDKSRPEDGAGAHPHSHPDRRFRLDLHRHLWDAHRAGQLRQRAGMGPWATDNAPAAQLDPAGLVPQEMGCAVDRWASEAAILLRSQGQAHGTVIVRLGAKLRLSLHVDEYGDTPGASPPRIAAFPAKRGSPTWPYLPDAATWVLPDLALLRTGLIDADRLHPLVATALVPGHTQSITPRSAHSGGTRLVDCRGTQHRIGLVDGVLVPLDHDPAEIRREALLAALGGTQLACLRMIDEIHRNPECLDDVRARLDHGDALGALDALEILLGPEALLRDGALRDELEAAVQRRILHGLYRAGLAGQGPVWGRTRPQMHATSRTPRTRSLPGWRDNPSSNFNSGRLRPYPL